jgi:transcriptional regulator with XRE-family HTH domain
MAVRGQRQRLRTRLATSVRRLRSERSWTQEQAAEAAGLNPRHYQKIEEGTVNTTLRTLELLCRGFSVDVVELLKP